MEQSPKDKRTQKGLEFIRVTVPSERAAQLRKLAADEGITLQGLVAPVLNSLAKQELRREYIIIPQPSSPERRF